MSEQPLISIGQWKRTEPGKMTTVLVIEDEPNVRKLVTVNLISRGYAVLEATNAPQALERLRTATPDLMILDIMMATETEGFDIAYELKNRPGSRELPIILLTRFLEKVREDGPDKFQHIMGEAWPAKWLFEKPVDTKKLVAKIEGILAGG